MKVLVVSERLWPDGSGGELATNLVLDLLRKEFEVKVITGTRKTKKVPGVNYFYEPLLSKRDKASLWFNLLRLVKRPSFRKLLVWSDIIYVPRFSFPCIPFAKRLGKKIIVHLHTYIPVSYTATVLAPYEEHKNRLMMDDLMLERMKGAKHYIGAACLYWLPKLARKWVAEANVIICVSHRQAKIISDLAPEFTEKIKVIYNPPPQNLLNRSVNKSLSNKPIFLYVGGDSYIKGFHTFLKASKELLKHRAKAKFILTNEYSVESRMLIQRFNNSYGNAYILLGRVNYATLLKLHEKVWGLIFPSIWEEPLPYAILESTLMGTLPLASKVGGIPEIVEKTFAEKTLFVPGDFNSLTKYIEWLLAMDNSQLMDIGLRLKDSMLKRFSKEIIERNLLRVILNTRT